MPVIQMAGLTKRFGHVSAVQDLNLTVEEGDCFGFLGPNGAGKTTTMRMLVGLLRPTSGTVRVWGYDPLTEAMQAKRHFGFVPDLYSFYDSFTARENLEFFASLSHIPREERGKRIQELLDYFGLADKAEYKVGGYSHGMKQRLVLAQALLSHPRLLILDEPTVGLDPRGQHEVRDFIKRISREGTTIFISSHMLFEIEDICNQVGILNQGKLVRSTSIEGLKAEMGAKQGIRLRIEGEGIEGLLKHVEAVEGVLGVKGETNTISVTVSSSEVIPLLVTAIVSNGGKIRRMEELTPTLEEVYLQLTG